MSQNLNGSDSTILVNLLFLTFTKASKSEAVLWRPAVE